MPHLDLIHKSEVWGIKSGGVAVRIIYENSVVWNSALAVAKAITVGSKTGALPTRTQFYTFNAEEANFNSTVGVLTSNGITADVWLESWHWTSEDYSSDSAYSFRMAGGGIYNEYYKHNLFYVRVILPL